MPRYRVHLHQTVVEEAFVVVDAPSREAAPELAIAKASSGDVEWNFIETTDEPRHVSAVEEIGSPEPLRDKIREAGGPVVPTRKEPYRLRITDNLGNKSYFVRNADGKTSHYGANETPLSLAYLTPDAAELRFAMIDAANGVEAGRLMAQAIGSNKKVELIP